MNNKWYRNLLCCPLCRNNLDIGETVECNKCGFHNTSVDDLRPNKPRHYSLNLPSIHTDSLTDLLNRIDISCPDMIYKGPNALRDSRQLMSEIAYRVPLGGYVLDLGCGPRDQFDPLNYLGFRYVGIDYTNQAADLLADIHAIPFHNDSFDCIFSYAVLEHLYNPFIVINEIARVLKPNGWFIGTVSQGEPFHNSYFHLTPWGLLSLINTTQDLKLVRLWGSSDTLQSLASMGRYSRVIKALLWGLNLANIWLPWLTPRKMFWPEREKRLDCLYRAGSICFSIQKSVSSKTQK